MINDELISLSRVQNSFVSIYSSSNGLVGVRKLDSDNIWGSSIQFSSVNRGIYLGHYNNISVLITQNNTAAFYTFFNSSTFQPVGASTILGTTTVDMKPESAATSQKGSSVVFYYSQGAWRIAVLNEVNVWGYQTTSHNTQASVVKVYSGNK